LAARTELAGGHVYHLTNDQPVDVALLVRSGSLGLGRSICAPVVPLAVGRAFFAGLRAALGLAGRSDLARHAPGTFEMLTRDNPFTSNRARIELGWNPCFDPAVRLAEAFHWWKRGRAAPTGG